MCRLSPCQSCHAGCCRSFAVPLTGADILRIERDRGLSFEEFACRWPDPRGLIARNDAPHFRFDDEPQTPFVICLIHEESRFLPGTSRCRFLIEGEPDAESPMGAARCGIYAGRPAACRAFPTRLDATGELAVLQDVPVRGRANDHPAYALCPREWAPSDLDPIDTVQNLVVARYETAFFRRLAEAWNRRPGPWHRFPEFLRLAYARRLSRETPAEDQMPAAGPTPTGGESSVNRAA